MNRLILAVSVILAVSHPCYAVSVSDNTEDLLTPTLDKMHSESTLMPSGSIYPKSGYNLESVENSSPNTISKYLVNETNGNISLTEKYYKVNINPSDNKYLSAGHYTNTTSNSSTNLSGKYEDLTIAGDGSANGSAISNYGYPYTPLEEAYLGDIEGYFKNNTASSIVSDGSPSYAYGGAIYNYTGGIGDVVGNFIENKTYAESDGYVLTRGGAIHSTWADVGNITGDFIKNSVIGISKTSQSIAEGGAILQHGNSIGQITGDFIANSVHAQSVDDRARANGGAIYVYTAKLNLKGDFISNSASSFSEKDDALSNGGALYITFAESDKILGDFVNNSTLAESESAKAITLGGAIYLYETTAKVIEANFVNNSVQATGYSKTEGYGGAINQSTAGTINKIEGLFYKNNVTSSSESGFAYAGGGAIQNESNGVIDEAFIETIKGNFIENKVTAKSENKKSYAYGGAVYNTDIGSKIGSIEANFINNSVSAQHLAAGGAIYNDNIIESIYGNFSGNSVTASNDLAFGGAIYHEGETKIIEGNFLNNTASGRNETYGGAIYTTGHIDEINGNFEKNSVSSTRDYASGGAIYTETRIEKINADFSENFALADSDDAYGGAIYSNEKLGEINGNFSKNYVLGGEDAYGGAIYSEDEIGSIKGSFSNNYTKSTDSYSEAQGGAIYADDDIEEITADFNGNYTSAVGTAEGGAIYSNWGDIGSLKGNFTGNYAYSKDDSAAGGAIYGESNTISGNFIGNYAKSEGKSATGGAISNSYIGALDGDYNIIGGFVNSSFINNYAEVNSEDPNAYAKGGAIYAYNTNVNITADNGVSIFSGNKTLVNGKQESNAIYIATIKDMFESPDAIEYNRSINLLAKNNGTIKFDDKIDGGVFEYDDYDGHLIFTETNEYAYKLRIKGDSTGKVIFNNEVNNANIEIEDTNVIVTEGAYLNNTASLSINSGTVEIQRLQNQNLNFNKFSLNGTMTLNSVDVDLANKTMGKITADQYGDMNGKMYVKHLNLLTDAKNDSTYILFAQQQFANNVIYDGNSSVAYSPIYKYNVSYSPQSGEFAFIRGGGSSNPSDSFNPAVLVKPVTNQAAGYTTQQATFQYAFQHADTFMQIPYLERMSIMKRNKYALSPSGDATDVGVFSPLFSKDESNGIWMKPYSSFESIPLKNGPKVNNINYGTLIGYDTELTPIGHGFERVITGYIGYNGASQHYQGISSNQNGGILGATGTFYKGNFFTAFTISAGSTAGDTTTMYGNESYAMLIAGAASKSGYNFEFNEGKFIIQPSFLISYTFVNTFDYTNAAGIRMKSDPLNAIQLAPGIKFIGNLKGGWQPYLGVNMVWNLLDKQKVTANDVRLPEMSIKPYVEYGVGLQKRWRGKYTAYLQAMMRNGGRNGIALSAGFRWSLGKKSSSEK